MKPVVRPNGKNIGINMELFAPNVVIKSITGNRTKSVMNANDVNIARVYVATR
jgi:hypothetical protein